MNEMVHGLTPIRGAANKLNKDTTNINTARFGKYIADWSVRHKNTYDAMYDVSVFSNKYKAIQQILIR
jgi:hypothetical protein